jgi:hypothetical protein
MSTIVLHVGMPKAGSSTIQRWLRDNDAFLESTGRHLLVYRHTEETPHAGEVVRRKRGPVNSGNFTFWYNIAKRERWFVHEFVDALDRQATELGMVVLTGEGIAQLFAEPDAPFLEELDALAARHTVRVAYYVRAQHESLEAAWRQWGFRHVWEPSRYMEVRQQLLDYEATLRQVRSLAPGVDFGMRLFHRAAFVDTSIVEDFARVFLDLDTTPVDADIWANPGLPLELANVLRLAESGRFFSSLHENSTIARLKTLTAGWQLPESPSIHRSRLVLQQHCHDRFEAGNARLIDELGWPIDHLVPAVDEPGFSYDGLQELDRLWSSSASDAERELVFVALESLLARDTGDRGATSGQATDGAPTARDDRRVDHPHRAVGRRANASAPWMRALSSSVATADSPRLVRDDRGSVFLVEGGRTRAVRSGLVAAALEECLGAPRVLSTAELSAMPDGIPIELFEDPDQGVFLVFGGQYHRARGVPLTHPVEAGSAATFPIGAEVDVAHANVAVSRFRRRSAGATRLARVRDSLHRRGIVGTAKATTKRVLRGLRRQPSR